MSSLGLSKFTTVAAIANAATVNVPYPAGLTQAMLIGSTGGSLALNSNDVFPQAASGAGTVAFTFNGGDVTVTNNSGFSWPAGSVLTVGFGTTDAGGLRYENAIKVTPAIVDLTAATGTASNTIADVTGAFVQATLNNNFKSLASKISEITAALRKAGLTIS